MAEQERRALAGQDMSDYIAHLVNNSTMPKITLSYWTSLLENKSELSPDTPEITLAEFSSMLRKTQREGAPRFPHPMSAPACKRPAVGDHLAVVAGTGNWFTDVLLANADLLEYLCRKYLARAECVALRMTCRLHESVTKCLRSKCPVLLVAGTKEHFPHGRTKQNVAFVGLEKEVGVAVALSEPHAPDVVSIGHRKYCVDATVASKFKVDGLRDRTYERGVLRKVQIEDGESWHSPPAGKYFEKIPRARIELRVADTDEVVTNGMIATRSSTIGLLTKSGDAMEFRLGVRYYPPRRVAVVDGVAHYARPVPDSYGPSVATVYVGFKLAPKLLRPPYRKKSFYLSVSVRGKKRLNGTLVDVETASRGEVFEVRRRAAPAMSQSKKEQLVAAA